MAVEVFDVEARWPELFAHLTGRARGAIDAAEYRRRSHAAQRRAGGAA
ncbi:MAG: hypothetical protein FWD11_06165 [Micrococcales bacterium]|nr:hypothetical protein [Micrococcales bacterium]